ncbi:P-loop containing nucleoside triphosphate hydrolase protein [Pisolithus croceorrhizus]|nr:P-loop containing nucleoside triphosphate hydrolase protein [Pisolithus croceorrhizus]
MHSSCGIDLVLFSIKGSMGQSEDFVHCYDEVYAKECQREIPVALVATGLEWTGGNMHSWWEKNKDIMFHLGLAFNVHACVTTLHSHDDPCIQEQIDISRKRVEALLQIQDYAQQLSHDPICSVRLIHRRREHSGGIPCSPEMNGGIYESLRVFHSRPPTSPTRITGSLQTRTVVIVGATGVGKSSIINAIAGEKRAQISSDTDPCTRECKAFLVELKPGVITELWDTVGWDASLIKSAAGHVQNLVDTRGIDLLLFCVRAGGRAESHVETFKSKIQPICRKETPVALVVTGLEDESDMDAWWTNNKDASVFHELIVDAHACVTTVARSTNPLHQQQIRYSLRRLRELNHRPILSSISFYELTRECAVILCVRSPTVVPVSTRL